MRRAHRAIHPMMWTLVGVAALAMITIGLVLRPDPPASELPDAALELLDGEGG